jgi:hypothetical protein
MSERKRGVPFPKGFPNEEAKFIGPYPVFGQWWNSVKYKIPEAIQLSNEEVEILHEFYVLRRSMQNERRKRNEEGIEELRGQITEFWQRTEQIDRDFEERNSKIILFIRERTE